MTTPWGLPDFDAHEALHFVNDEASRPAGDHRASIRPISARRRAARASGIMPTTTQALTDALRLSRGMSYKNAMAGLPLGGGKSVILADEDRTKSPELLAAFGKAVDGLGGRYVTAEDVGMSVNDMIEVAPPDQISSPAFRPRAASRRRSRPAHLARRVPGPQGGGQARARQGQPRRACTSRCRARAASPPASRSTPRRKARRLSIADVDAAKAQKLADATGGTVVAPDDILTLEADVLSPNALGAILDRDSDRRAAGADRRRRRQQPARDARGRRAAARSAASSTRPIMSSTPAASSTSAPNISATATPAWCASGSRAFPAGSSRSGPRAQRSGRDPAAVADAMAQRLIGRG